MCHMVGDTDEELHAMADKIGVARKWFQLPGTYKRHYDIAMSKRQLAVDNGAVEITMSAMGRLIRNRRLTGALTCDTSPTEDPPSS